MKVVSIRILFLYALLLVHPTRTQNIALAQSTSPQPEHSTGTAPVTDPLIRLLMSKGLMTTQEGELVGSAGNAAQQRDRLATLLKDKGLISTAEFHALRLEAPGSSVADNDAGTVNASPSLASAAHVPSATAHKAAPAPSFIATIFTF